MMRIVLPWPPKELSPNARPHHMAKRRALNKARSWGFAAAKEARVSIAAGDVPVILTVTFCPKTRNKVDQDNAMASCKAYFDGIADALGVNDSLFRFREPVMAEPVKGGQVIVEIAE